MKRKFMFIIASLSLFVMTSCSNESAKKNVITEISEEVEVTQLHNSYMSVYESVNKGCCGIVAKSNISAGTGSAVIYKYKNGYYYAVTNAHIVTTKDDIYLYFGDNKYVDGEIVGIDETNDVAVVKFTLDGYDNIDIKPIEFMDYETTDLVSVGQSIVCIGCPLSLENYNDMATGIISHVSDLKLTTDASLNPGNSGGGVFNMAGRFIGLNFKKEVWTTSGGQKIPVEGRSYIIPFEVVKNCILDIEKLQTSIERPLIGITLTTVNKYTAIATTTAEYLEYLPAGVDYGFVITAFTNDVIYGKRAGLLINDVIVKVNGIPMTSSDVLSSILHKITKEDSITLTVYRKSDNQNHDIVVSFKD